MKFLKFFFLVCFLTSCSGRQNLIRYIWPEKNKTYSLSETIVKMKEDSQSTVVIFISSDFCPPCRKLKEYWKSRTSPIPFYVVEYFTITPAEKYALILLHVPDEIPVCITILGEKHDIGVGYEDCSGALEVKLKNLKPKR